MINVGQIGVPNITTVASDNNDPKSPQHAVIYDLISEGEIEGLVDGVSSVFLNGTRLVSTSYRSNTNSITIPSGRFRTGNTTVTANSGNLGGTAGRYIILQKGANNSTSFSGNVGEVRLRSNLFFTANMGVNPYLISSLAPKIRIAGLGPGGREYVGTIQQVIDSNTAIVDTPFFRTATAQSGGIDLVTTIVSASANSITVANAPLANGSIFQILPPAMPTDISLSDDRWNFKSTAVGFRTGTRDQSPIIFPYVPSASFLTSIEQDLQWGNEWGGNAVASAYSSNDLGVPDASEIDNIKVAIEFPAGLYQNGGESGKRGPSFAGFQIKFSYVQNGETKTVITHGPVDSTGIPVGKRKQNRWTGWLENKSGYMRHEITTAFVSTLSIPVEQFKPFSAFSVIISRTNPEGTDNYDVDDATLINSSRLKYIECQILDKFSYPLSAYAAVSVPAEGFSSPPSRSYHVRGIKVSVPSNYTTREENRSNFATYTGAWDGSFVTKYTNNPAWIFYDLATNKRYGLGKHIDSSMVDKYALYRIARYCDELVDDGKGGLEPRFTCNVYIYEAEEAYKLLRDLATTFRGITYWMQGALVPVQDSPKEPVYTFTQGNIVDGIFNYEYSGRNTRYNEVNITWNNPDQFYQQDVLTVTDQTDIIKRGKTIPMESVAFGCTSEGQAYRVALWNMLTSQLETEFISFTTGMNASVLMPGDIINVQDQHLKAIQASGRIKSALSSSNITLDRNVTLTSGSQYQLHVIYDGPGCYLQQATATIGATTYIRGDLIPNIATSTAAANLLDNSGNPVAVSFSPEVHVQKRAINNSLPYSGNNITLSSGFLSTPNVESVWALENITLDNNVEPKKYRILGIKEEQGGTYSIVASQYATQKFAELESKVKIQPEKYTKPKPGDEVPPIQGLDIAYARAYDGDINTALDSSYYALISWSPGLETYTDDSGNSKTRDYPYIDTYEVQHNFFDAPSTSEVELTAEIVKGSTSSLKVYGVPAGVYTVKVRAKNIFGQYSSWVSRQIPLVQQSIQSGFNINGIVSGGAVDSGVIFSSNTFTVLDSYYTFTTPSGRIYTVNAATSAQSAQSFANLRSNYEYYLLWDAANTTDPWKAIEYYYDPSISQPYGIGNSYWKEATATSNGLTQLSGTINVAINTNKVTGSGTFFYDTLSIGGLVKLQSSNAANSFYATVGSIVSNTEFYTRETITKSFTSQTIFIPSLPIDYKNDVIAAKIVTGSGNVASLDIQYVTSTVNEPQLLVLDTNSSGFRYDGNNALIGPTSITFAVNRQNLLGPTNWYVFDANNNSLSNSVLETRTNTSAIINSTSFGNISNNNFIRVRTDVDTLTSNATIFKIRDGVSGANGAPGANGANGTSGVSAATLTLSKASVTLFAYADGNVDGYADAAGQASLYLGNTNVTESTTWASSATVGLTGTISNTSGSKGQYSVSNLATANNTGALTITALYSGLSYTGIFSVAKAKGGYEIVNTLPSTNLFQGRVTFLTTDNKLYRYTGTAWVTAVPNTDISGLVTDAQLAGLAAGKITGQLTDAQIAAIANTKIVGQLTDSQIAAIANTKITGQLTDAQIAAIANTKIVGQLTDSQLAAIASTKITGQLTDAQIAAIANTKIVGQLTDSQIAAIANTKIVGQLVDSQIAAIANTKIVGQLTDSQLAEIASTKITGQLTDAQIAAVANTKITGQIIETQISNNAITTPKLAAGAVTANEIAANTITANQIAANAITAEELAAGSVTTAKLTANAVTANEIAAASITTAKLAAGAVTANEIAANTITANQIAANAITADEIAANAVTAAKIAANTITANEIAANAITASELAAGSVTTAKLTANAVTANEIAAASITTAKIAAGAVTANEIAANTITANQIAANAITASELAAGSVTTAKLTANAVTANEIAAASITTAKIAAGAVTANEIAANSITANEIAANAITASELAAGSVTTAKLTANAVTANEIAANAVTAAQIAAGAVITAKLAAGAVTANEIAAGAVIAGKIAADAVTANEIAANAVTANEIAAGAVTAGKMNVTFLSAISGNVGTLNAGTIDVSSMNITGTSTSALNIKSATSGERMELGSSVIKIFDSSGTLRVKIGNLA